ASPGSFARGEWEEKIEGAAPEFDHIGNTPLASLATRKTRRKLRPVFETSVQRAIRPLRLRSSEVELAVDRGRLSAGRHAEPISELELELKKGRASDLFRVASVFGKRARAELDLRSKAERGYRLANGSRQVAMHAETIELTDKMNTVESFNVQQEVRNAA